MFIMGRRLSLQEAEIIVKFLMGKLWTWRLYFFRQKPRPPRILENWCQKHKSYISAAPPRVFEIFRPTWRKSAKIGHVPHDMSSSNWSCSKSAEIRVLDGKKMVFFDFFFFAGYFFFPPPNAWRTAWRTAWRILIIWDMIIWHMIIWHMIIWHMIIWHMIIWDMIIWDMIIWHMIIWHMTLA